MQFTLHKPTIQLSQLPNRRNNTSTRCRSLPQQQPATERTSLIPQTIDELENDTDLQQLHSLIATVGQATLTRDEQRKRQRSLDSINAPSFLSMCRDKNVSPLIRKHTSIFQLNIGLYCNQACRHCHVESSPKRTEFMPHDVAERCIELLKRNKASTNTVQTLDITGGAPELAPEFRYLVTEARKLGVEVIDRCNLTVLLEPGQEDLAPFLADNQVRVVASLPCYSKENVDTQRGGGVFSRSIQGLQMLNALGYGKEGSGLGLDLVYNPGGVFLAPAQETLEGAYKQELKDGYGIEFSRLFCLNNMPIKRWADELVRQDKLEEYMALLVHNFNPEAAEGLMCRDTLSVRYDGTLYDCDFNQQLDIGIVNSSKKTVFDVESVDDLLGSAIAVESHCFGCTAGAGSSCQGATS